jgi:hypothetical protein
VRIAPLLLPALFLAAACASDRTRVDDSALVEVNTYAQRKNTRWVITGVRVRGVRDVEGTFEIPPGPQSLEIEWSRYDATEKFNVGVFLLPVADRAKKVDSGTQTIDFEPVSGKLYRLQFTPVATPGSISSNMTVTLVDSGLRPAETG